MRKFHLVSFPRTGELDGRIRVVAAVIERNGRYLIGLRPAHKRHGGLWEFPGGKLDDGEENLRALQRELKEEMELEVLEIERPLFAANDPESRFHVVFVPAIVRGHPQALEHQEIRWADLAELERLKLAPTDNAFVSAVLAASRGRLGCEAKP